MLNWGWQRGHILITKSSNIYRQIENLNSLSFKLSEEEIAQVAKMDIGIRVCDGSNYFPCKMLSYPFAVMINIEECF